MCVCMYVCISAAAARLTATCKMKGKFQRFSMADLF